MNSLFIVIKTFKKIPPWGTHVFIFFLYFLHFRRSFLWILETLSDVAFFEYGIAFLLLLIIIGISLYLQKSHLRESFEFRFKWPAFAGFFFFLLLDTLNIFFLHHSLISALSFILGLYFLIGFYFKEKLWERWFYVVAILCLMLPFLPHIQTFFGFPLRIFTAHIVSGLLTFLHIPHFSTSTILITENNATSIDLPCSGVKSIYAGLLYALILNHLMKIRLSFRLLAALSCFLGLLIFFNLWRVFSLVYVYDVLGMKEYGNAIHIFLGVLGFTISCLVLLKLNKNFILSKITPNNPSSFNEKTHHSKPRKKYGPLVSLGLLSIVLLFFLFSTELYSFFHPVKSPPENTLFEQNNYSISLPGYQLKEIPFTDKEKGFFVNREVIFSKKYRGRLEDGRVFDLLLVKSKSWKTHHNPEICLQGMGYSIDGTTLFSLEGMHLKQVTVNQGEGTAFYWFSGKEGITLMDYSERVWEGILHPEEPWTLVEVGFEGKISVNSPSIQSLFTEIEKAL